MYDVLISALILCVSTFLFDYHPVVMAAASVRRSGVLSTSRHRWRSCILPRAEYVEVLPYRKTVKGKPHSMGTNLTLAVR